jgi:5,10-methylene-tetrahydrofolate dehydrogenase/methenyl tetrahydrofolate cyclohydrolase
MTITMLLANTVQAAERFGLKRSVPAALRVS